jgi:hypothetical protein
MFSLKNCPNLLRYVPLTGPSINIWGGVPQPGQIGLLHALNFIVDNHL